MGFTSLLVQTLLIREFLVTFYGNELIIGIILANWLALEGLGSSLLGHSASKTKNPLVSYALLQVLISLYFPLSILLTRIAKSFFGANPGEVIGLAPIFVSTLLILAPLSLCDGAEFPFGCRIYSEYLEKPAESVGRVYILEAIGFIIAGPVFTYLLVTRYHSVSIALIVGLLNLLSAFFLISLSKRNGKRKFFGFLSISLSFLYLYFFLFNFSDGVQSFSIAKQWGGRNVVSYRNSIYGNLCVTKDHEQYTFFADGMPVVVSPYPDVVSVEEFSHFSLLSHPFPEEILLLGGGAGGILSEILKHPVTRVDYTELDPLLIATLKEYPTVLTEKELSNPRVKIIYIDSRRFVKVTRSRYDLVLANLPPPSTLNLNRFYTVQFFQSVRKILKSGGILVFGLPGSLTSLSEELRNLNGSVLKSLKDVFPEVRVIPGETNLYLGSLESINVNPAIFEKRLEERGVNSRLLSHFYFDYRLNQKWFDWFKESLGDISKIKKNYDLVPVGLFYELTFWSQMFVIPKVRDFFRVLSATNLSSIFLTVAGLSLVILIIQKPFPKTKELAIPYAVFTTGFLGMTLDLVLVFVYQSLYGYIYHHLALLIAFFMSGLTSGGWLVTKRLKKFEGGISFLLAVELGFTFFSLLLVPLFLFVSKITLEFGVLFFILAAIAGFLVGLEFPLANKLYQRGRESRRIVGTAGILYALDLFGACFGALVVSVYLVPVIGVINTCLLLALFKISSLVFLFSASSYFLPLTTNH